MGLASVACYLSLHLGIALPRDILFLGEVEWHGHINLDNPLNKVYLDLCLEAGFSVIVGPSANLAVLVEEAKKERYKGVKIIGLDNALDIVPKLCKALRVRG